MAQEVKTQEVVAEEVNNSKVTKEELEQIQEYDKKLQQMQFSLGDLSILKHNISKRHTFLTGEYDKMMEEKDTFVKGMNEKYGEVTISKEDGQISTPPSPPAAQ